MSFGSLHHHSSDQETHSDMAEINMIPLVDVMLVLLIVFMVAAPLSISGIKIDLPSSKAKGDQVQESRIILSVDAKGKFYIDKVRIPDSELVPKIRAIYEFKENKELYIRADRSVRYEKVVDAMSAAKEAGVQKIGMLTVPPKQQEDKKL